MASGHPIRVLDQLETLSTQPQSVQNHTEATPAAVAAPPTNPGSRAWADVVAPSSPYDLAPAGGLSGTARARVAAVARRLKLSPKAAAGARVTAPTAMPEVLPYAPPPAQTRLPIGGASAGGGIGSPAPPVLAAFAVLALAFLTAVLGRFSLDMASWRSTLLASRLEHPD